MLAGVRLHRAARRTGHAACRRRRQAARHRPVDLRRGHRAGRLAHRVRCRRDPRRRHRQRVRRHERARAGPPHRVRDAGERGARHPDGQDQARQLRHRRPFPAAPARWGRARCRPPAARSTSRRSRCSIGRRRSPLTCSRRPPTTSSSARAGCTSPVCRRRACRGPISPRRRRMRRSCPTDVEPGILRHELDFDGTDSTFPFGCHVSVVEVDTETGAVHDAAPRRGRRLRAHPQPDARRRAAARRHRAGRGAGAVRMGPVRRRRQPGDVEPHRLRHPVPRPSCAASRRRTRRPTAPATRSERRASASRARSARRRRSTTRSSTRCRISA